MNKNRLLITKSIIFLVLIFLALPVFSEPIVETPIQIGDAKPLEIGVTFDWISKTQLQRDENIKEIQSILFADTTTLKYSKKEFKQKYESFLKNRNFLNDYDEISKGKKEDADKYYCGFYAGKLMIAYGIQYKNNMKNIYYYDAMGNLRWADIFSDNYPKYPCWSYQYYRNGDLVAAYYFVSKDDQYIFGPNMKFKGRWFKEKLYNRNAKVIMTRTNY